MVQARRGGTRACGVARVDDRGRVTIPERARKDLNITPGDVLFYRREGNVIYLVKPSETLWDDLAEQAIQEYRAGRTQDIRDIARELGVDLDAK